MSKEKTKYCPKCGKIYHGHPALSRMDNKTEICPDCGTKEAIDSIPKHALSPQERTRLKVAATGNKMGDGEF